MVVGVPGFAKLGEVERFRGAVVSVGVGTFRGPDGSTFRRDVVHHPGAVSVVPVLDGTHAVMLLQYRAALDAEVLEIPAGKRDVVGEPIQATAAREVAEEIGMEAGRLELLARFHNSPGFSDEESFVFLGLELRPCAADLQGVEEQHSRIEHVALAEVPALIAGGRLTDAKSIIGLTLARAWLGSGGGAGHL